MSRHFRHFRPLFLSPASSLRAESLRGVDRLKRPLVILGLALAPFFILVAPSLSASGPSNVVLYVGGDAVLSNSAVVSSPLVDGKPTAAAYIKGKLTTSGSVNLSQTDLYVGARGDEVPPLSTFMPDWLMADLVAASQVAQPDQPGGTVLPGLTLKKGSKTYTEPLTINGDLVLSGPGPYIFGSVYVTGKVVISGDCAVTFGALNAQGSLTFTGGTAPLWGPTYVGGNVTLSSSGQKNFTLLVVNGVLTITAGNIAGDGTGTNPKPATILLVGSSKAVTYSTGATLCGILYNKLGGLVQTAGTIKGSVLLGGSYSGSGYAAIRYLPTVSVTPPPDQTVEATGPDGAPVFFSGSATDIIDGSIPAESIHYYTAYGTGAQAEVLSGATFPLGSTMVTMTAVDRAGYLATASFTVTVVDTTPPTGSLDVNGGASSASSPALTLALGATDVVGVTGYRAAEGLDASGAATVAVDPITDFATEVAFDVSSGDGEKTVAVQYCDAAGNWSATYTHSITLQAPTRPPIDFYPVAPRAGDLLVLYGGGATTPADKVDGVTYTWTISDGMNFQYYDGIGQVLLLPRPGVYTIDLRVVDEDAPPSTFSQTLAVDRSVAHIAPLVTEVVAGRPAQVKARFLDPGWHETHTADWTTAADVAGASLAEDHATGMNSGLATATITAAGAVGDTVDVGLDLRNEVGGPAGSATLELKIVGSDEQPLALNSREFSGDLAEAPSLRSGGAYLSFVQSRGDVDFFKVVGPDGEALPYGTEVLASLSSLPADFDLAIFEDAGVNTDAVQQLPFVGSPSLSSSVLDTKVPWDIPFDIKVPWDIPFDIKVPWDIPFGTKVPWDIPFTAKVPWDIPFDIKVPWDIPYRAQAWLASPLGTANPLDGYPLSGMSFTGLSTENSSGTDLSFGELGFSYEALFANKPGLRVAAFSANRGTEDDVVLATVQNSGSTVYVGIIGANGAYSTEPYTLTLETSLPNTLAKKSSEESQPEALVDPAIGSPDTQLLYAAAGSPKTIFITQRERFDGLYGAGSWEQLRPYLQEACDDPLVGGVILSVPAHLADGQGTALYDEFDKAPYRIDLANAIAAEIRGIIQGRLQTLEYAGVEYVVIVGGDRIIPFRRVCDQTTVGNERAYQYGSYLMNDTPLFAGLAAGSLLTDDYYVDQKPVAYNGSSLYIPDISISRLVETPTDIIKAVDTFLTRSDPATQTAPLRGSTALVTGFSFFADGARNVQAILSEAGLASVVSPPDALISELWTGSALRSALFGTTPGSAPADVASINAHFTHFAGVSAEGYARAEAGGTIVADDLLTTGDLSSAQDSYGDVLAGRLILSMGCHTGYNVPNEDSTINGDRSDAAAQPGTDPSLDFAEAVLSQGGVLVGNTGFGYGDFDVVSYSEAIIGNLARAMTSGGKSIGQALAEAKREYLGSLSAVTPYDGKASLELELYGMPHYTLDPAGDTPAAPLTAVAQTPDGAGGDMLQAVLRAQATESTVPQVLALSEVGRLTAAATAPSTFTLTVIDPAVNGGNPTVHTYDLAQVESGSTGSYFTATEQGTGAKADCQATAGRPIQPRVVIPLPASGTGTVRSVEITSGTYTDLGAPPDAPFDPVIADVAVEWGVATAEPKTSFSGWWPAVPAVINSIETGGVEQNLVVNPGQFLLTGTDAGGNVTGTERLWSDMTVQVVRSTTDDYIPPTVSQVDSTIAERRVHMVVKTTSTDVSRIVVHECSQGFETIHEFSGLDPAAGVYDLYFDLAATSIVDDVRFTIQVFDGAGNSTHDTDKGVKVWSTAVAFPDPNLEAAVREELGIFGRDITSEDMAALTFLDASYRGIVDLRGLEYAVNLASLGLFSNLVVDLMPLAGLDNLRLLDLANNPISSLTPLSGLTGLRQLYLSNNEVNSLEALRNLTNLAWLYVSFAQVSDLEPLTNHKSLIVLNLTGNLISDLKPLSGLNNLSILYLGQNQITDLAPLVANTGLGEGDQVDLTGNYLDLAPGLRGMKDIATLETRGVNISYEQQKKAELRASLSAGGAEADNSSFESSISADGRYVAFTSGASNLVAGDSNGLNDVFVKDRQTGATVRVSVATDGTQGDDMSSSPSISADGRYVAFMSPAKNLVAEHSGSSFDVFLRDRDADEDHVYDEDESGAVTTVLVSAASDGTMGWGHSYSPSISADGRFIAFASYASNLVSDDTNGSSDIFVKNRETGAIVRVSVASGGTQADENSLKPSISGDGRFIAFASYASNLVSDDTNGSSDVFVHDRDADSDGTYDEDEPGAVTTVLVSAASDGTQGNSGSLHPSISADGRYVAFWSGASNLVSGDLNHVPDIFVKECETGAIVRVSVASDGTEANNESEAFVSISQDGRYVAFETYATNLVPGGSSGWGDVFVRDRDADSDGTYDEDEPGAVATVQVSLASDGTQGNSVSSYSSISADGRYVAFASDATNLVYLDTNGRSDVFVRALLW